MMAIQKITCPKCGSDQCFPAGFRCDVICVPCGNQFDWRGETLTARILRKIFYR